MDLIIVSWILAPVAAVISTGDNSAHADDKTAPYRVVRTDGDFELREYPTLTIVQTPMRGSDDSFMRLFRYIGGQNSATQKIAMTTPVFMTSGATNATMAFVMPQTMEAEQVPQPKNPDVAVSSIPAGQFVVRRFSGRRTTENETNAVAALTGWMQTEKLAPVGEPMFGYFDPPWTLPFLRRNEVMWRIAP